MDAEERVAGVGDGVDQHFDEVLTFGTEGVKLATERDDEGRGLRAAESGDAVAVKAGAVDDLFGREFARGGLDDDALGGRTGAAGRDTGRASGTRSTAGQASSGTQGVVADGGGAGRSDDAAAALGDDLRKAAGDLAVIDDAGFGDVDAGEADAVRLELADLFRADAVADDAVLRAAFDERFHPREFGFFDGDDDLAAEVEGDVLARAELLHRGFAGAAIDRFERAGPVVDAGMHDAGVAAGLMAGDGGFLFEDGDGAAGEAFEEAVGGGQADDTAADDDEIGFWSRVLQLGDPDFEKRANLRYDCSMTRITVNEALLGQIGAGQEAELWDSSGKRLGYFLPDEVYQQLVCRWANAQVTDEELERCRKETESYSTAEVLERLRNL